jgi:2-polyprenyl-6-methoxyphenol hydroxylase-like FAD-dependent oxidoreductase
MKTLIFFLLFFSSLDAQLVVIIGGGPAGLSTAIEARLSGAEVIVVEKRPTYTREQWLFLLNSSVELLSKWQLTLPNMRYLSLQNGNSMALVEIKHLEETLAKKARELGVKRIEATFKGIEGASKVLLLTSQNEEKHLAYDVLVGADGPHSNVRSALPLELKQMGRARGASCLVTFENKQSKEVGVTEDLKSGEFWIKRIQSPAASIIFIQHPLHATAQDLENVTRRLGWADEAELISTLRAPCLEEIEILLQQAKSFSDRNQSALLVGDAAATASFYQGMGANSALKAAEIAGAFFKTCEKDPETAYAKFNQSMQEMTDALIEDSRPLFVDTP